MEPDFSAKLNELAKRVTDVSFQVANIVDSETEPELHDIDACHDAVAEVAALWSQIVAATPENERMSLERTHGRRVTDLRREAARLPKKSMGRTAKPAAPSAAGFPDYHLRVDPVTGVGQGGGALGQRGRGGAQDHHRASGGQARRVLVRSLRGAAPAHHRGHGQR